MNIPQMLSVSIFVAVSSTAVFASNYPPGYAVERSCQTQGPVEVCAVNQNYGGFPRLEIRYSGYLGAQGVNAWVQLNGREGTFAVTDGALYLNNPNAYMCVVGGTMPHYPACEYSASTSNGTVVWETKPVAEQEQQLFYYARNENGVGNAWDVSIAFVDGEGRWDSLFGGNYVFRFNR